MTYCPDILDRQTALVRATDAEYFRPILECKLSEAVGIDVRIAELAIPRVFVRADRMVFIQYMFKPQDTASHDSLSDNMKSVIVYGELGDSALKSHNSTKKGGKTIFVAELQMALHVFPFDNRLRQLAECFTTDSQALWFRPTDYQLTDSGLRFSPEEVLAYRYGKRSVLRGVLHNPDDKGTAPASAFLKISRPRFTAKALTAQDIIEESMRGASGDQFALARNLFTNISRGVIISEAVSSPTLFSMLGKSAQETDLFVTACYRIGRLLSAFQTCPVPDSVPLSIYTAIQEFAMLEKRALLTGTVAPGYCKGLQRTLSALGDCPAGDDAISPALAHCDFYDKQVFVAKDKITLIDFDTLALADPVVDMANFLAHLSLRMRQDFMDESTLIMAQKSFMEGNYGNGKTPDVEKTSRLRWWYRATLIRLAALYALRPKWRHLTEILIADSMAGLPCESKG